MINYIIQILSHKDNLVNIQIKLKPIRFYKKLRLFTGRDIIYKTIQGAGMKSNKNNALLLLMCFLVYAISYIGKRTYSVNIVNVESALQVSKELAGYVSSAFFACYGVGQLANGFLCEKMNSKWTISVALLLSAILTAVMYFLTNVLAMAIIWGLNGLVLSVLWTHCIKLLATIKDEKYTARSVTVMSVTLPVGVMAAFGLGTLFSYLNRFNPDFWKVSYFVSAGLLAGVAVAFFAVISYLEKAQKPAEQTERPLPNLSAENQTQGGNLFKAMGFALVPVFLICVCTGLVRDGADTWLPSLLKDAYTMPAFFSILLTVGLPLMGVFSAILSTLLIKKTKNVMLSCLLAGGLATAIGVVLIFTFQLNMPLLVVLFMALSLTAYTLSNTLTSVFPLYYKQQIKSGQAAGIINTFVYLGSTVSSTLLGGLVDNFGWQSFMICMSVCAVIIAGMSVLGLLLLRKKAVK